MYEASKLCPKMTESRRPQLPFSRLLLSFCTIFPVLKPLEPSVCKLQKVNKFLTDKNAAKSKRKERQEQNEFGQIFFLWRRRFVALVPLGPVPGTEFGFVGGLWETGTLYESRGRGTGDSEFKRQFFGS
jgi:hypothetical protein